MSTSGSVHKINRNNHYRLEMSGSAVVTSTIVDNGFLNRVLPFYKESAKWFKSYLPSTSSFIEYVLHSATYTGSPLAIPSQVTTIESSPRFTNFRQTTSSMYDSLNYKEYELIRLGDKVDIKTYKKETRIHYELKPVIHNNTAQSGKYFTSSREPPIDYSGELIKYDINDEIDGYTSVYDGDFAHEELNRYYNVRNREHKYDDLQAIFNFDGDVKLKHRQTVYPNQDDIWNRNRPYFTFSSWIDKPALRIRDNSYQYEYSGQNLNLGPKAQSIITTMLLSDSNLYLAASNSINSVTRNGIGVIHKDSGTLGPFNPNISAGGTFVYSMLISGSNLYLGGDFTTVSGSTRNNLCVVDKDSGALGPFNPNVDDVVYSLLISNSNLYLGGGFVTVSGTTRNRIAVVDKDSGALGPFNPSITAGGTNVYSLLLSGSNLYVGGDFTTISGSTRNNIAVVDKDSGALGPFNPNVNAGTLNVQTMLLSGSNLYLGGQFSGVSSTTRNNIALVDKDSGALSPFNPNIGSIVRSLFLSGSNLYLGGDFILVSGTTRNRIAVVDKDSGALGPFNPMITRADNQSFSVSAYSLLISGSNLYIGGFFDHVSGSLRENIAIVNKDSGQLLNYGIYLDPVSSSSIWPLDAWKNNDNSYVYGEYFTGSSELNIHNTKPYNFTWYGLFPTLWTASYQASSSIWTVPEESNSYPFFNNENDYLWHIKPKYKDYSHVPEYIVSNFINDYSLNTGSYDIYQSGTLLVNQESFTNDRSQNKNIFNIKKDINKDITEVEFKLNYINLFRPYRDLYPVEKVLQISKILSNRIDSGTVNDVNSIGVDIFGNTFPLSIESASIVRNLLLEPFVSPGILWDTIKTGVPYIWPYITGSNLYSASTSFPFESIYNPFKYLNNIYLNSYNVPYGPYTASFTGTFSDQKYTDCVTNFIDDSTDFFLNTDSNLRYFSSKPENDFDVFLMGNTYGLLLSLDNYFNTSSNNNASSISPGFGQLGPVQGVSYSTFCPPYLKYFTLNPSTPSPQTYNKVKILFTPAQTGKYTLAEILSQSVVTTLLTDDRWNGSAYADNIKQYGQSLLKSYNIFEFEKLGEFDKIWNISGKWEVPIFDFRGAISKQVWSTYNHIFSNIGYGHQFGQPQNAQANLSLNITDVNGTLSLADMVGFESRTYQLGKLKQQQEVSELVCVVPVNKNDNSFIAITEDNISYIENVNYFDWFMFPVKYDYKYGTAKPYLMYCFETKMTLNSDDLSKIWQNVMPSQSFNHEEGSLIIRDNIVDNPQLNDLFEDNITWMIFKVKQKSLTNLNGKHTFNWPYENFSITELARLDVELGYGQLVNQKRKDDPSRIGRTPQKQRDIEIIDKGESTRQFPSKTPNGKQQDPLSIPADDRQGEIDQPVKTFPTKTPPVDNRQGEIDQPRGEVNPNSFIEVPAIPENRIPTTRTKPQIGLTTGGNTAKPKIIPVKTTIIKNPTVPVNRVPSGKTKQQQLDDLKRNRTQPTKNKTRRG